MLLDFGEGESQTSLVYFWRTLYKNTVLWFFACVWVSVWVSLSLSPNLALSNEAAIIRVNLLEHLRQIIFLIFRQLRLAVEVLMNILDDLQKAELRELCFSS